MISQADLASKLPEALKARFNDEGRLSLLATAAAQRFQKWFDASGLPFFPDYTDHTFEHSMGVFQTAVDMSSDEASAVLSGSDIAFLLMASCCHDAGMHVTEQQFGKLIANDYPQFRSALDDKPWTYLWANYLAEARRFSERQLIDIFGDEKPVRVPPDDPMDYSKRDRLLIGEFLRRHHPRLAHEIARGLDQELGLPRTLEGLDANESDLVGLVARSHGMSLRETLPYLESHFDLRDFQGCHAVYVMALLRIADCAQLQSARAPEIHSQIHNIRSPISTKEWRVHQSITNINNTHSDPEALFIDSRPVSIVDFVRVRDWLVDLQTELDISWAVLGEVYGRHKAPPLELLRLKVRRVRSNVLDPQRATFDFVPEPLAFRVAEAEMLSLLLAPLYGDHPMYGIRELVQNARDAALEARTLEEDAVAQPPSVHIQILTQVDPPTVTVTDNGVGMSFDVIRNYFLNAGASYRSSEEWRSTYLTSEGRSVVNRSGRFGVGALAAFLVGSTINVTTRHLGAPDGLGYQFTCRLQDAAIEVRRASRDIGTSITIETDEKRLKTLLNEVDRLGQVFHFNDVELSIQVDDVRGEPFTNEYRRPPPMEGSEILTFQTEAFPSVDVQIMPRDYYYEHRRTYINGIAVATFRDRDLSFGSGLYMDRELTDPLPIPSGYRRAGIEPNNNLVIYVTDPNAKASLSLARTNITHSDVGVDTAINSFFLEKVQAGSAAAFQEWKRNGFSIYNTGSLSLRPHHFVYCSGSAYLNDMGVIAALGSKTYCRTPASYDKLVELSQKFPSVIFLHGHTPTSKTEFVFYFRDLDRALAREGYGVLSLPKQELLDLLVGSGVPKWLKETLTHADVELRGGTEFALFNFGELEEGDFSIAESIRSSLEALPMEYFRSLDHELHKWVRWTARGARSPSPFASLSEADILQLLQVKMA